MFWNRIGPLVGGPIFSWRVPSLDRNAPPRAGERAKAYQADAVKQVVFCVGQDVVFFLKGPATRQLGFNVCLTEEVSPADTVARWTNPKPSRHLISSPTKS